jgi:hypothetical protein
MVHHSRVSSEGLPKKACQGRKFIAFYFFMVVKAITIGKYVVERQLIEAATH